MKTSSGVQNTQSMGESPKNMPEKKFRAGAISATVWKNTGQSAKGESVEFKTISLNRVYKDASGAWQHTTSLRLNDLPRASVALQKAYEYLVLEQDAVL
ncbi:MAG TPA: hypothetical protein VJH88_05475 [Candidatus Nanoarchaeia archaeon]|nr:hypothetical protein [Candidatus Nanoarchaeia archaeon]